jgi:hypothetical protein
MSVKVMDRVWELSQAKGAARLVLLALADWADDEGYCYPSLTAIVRKTQLTRPGVVQILRRLETIGEVEVTVRGHDTRDKVKAKVHSHGGWQPTNYYRVNVGNAVYCPRKQTVDNAVNRLPLTEVVNAIDQGSKRHASQVVNATDQIDPASLNDPSVDPSIEPSERARALSPERLVALWNAKREPGPKVTVITASRQLAYTNAAGESPNPSDWTIAIEWLNRQAYANAKGTGPNPTWRATLDWLAKPGQLAKVLEQAQTDAIAPPQRPRRLGDVPSNGLTQADLDARAEQLQRARDFQKQQDALADEAAVLVLTLSDQARAILERDVLPALEPYRVRQTAAAFDAMVCDALPRELVKRADGRPLADVVAELEGQVVAA